MLLPAPALAQVNGTGKYILNVTFSGMPAWIAQEGRSVFLRALSKLCAVLLRSLHTVLSFLLLVFGSPAGLRASERERPGQTHAMSVSPARPSLGKELNCWGGVEVGDREKNKGKCHVSLSLAPLFSCIKYLLCAYSGPVYTVLH